MIRGGFIFVATVALLGVVNGGTSGSSDAEPFLLAQVQSSDGWSVESSTQTYAMAMHARPDLPTEDLFVQAQVTMSTEVLPDRLVFDDQWILPGRRMRFTMTCRTSELLEPDRCLIQVEQAGEMQEATVTFEHGVATVKGMERTAEIHFPLGTVTQAALFRIIPQLTTEPGHEFVFFGYCDAIEWQVRQPQFGERFSIVCRGPETVELGGQERSCIRYTVNAHRRWDCYVDDQKQICKVVADNGSTVMVLQEGDQTASAP